MIIRTIAKQETIKKVAAYARVSTLAESQDESFDTQVKYYSDLITGTKDWSMVKIYADKGITGTSAEKRPGFQEMIRDANAGKIDIILCKSISRFARNVEEAQHYVHDLMALGIEIRFEKDGLSTSDPQIDLVLGMKMVVAQQESKSISENIRWANQRLADMGVHHVGSNHLLGYDEIDGEMIPNKDKWIIEIIFQCYADGLSISQIQKELTKKDAKTLRRQGEFQYSQIKAILKNEVYVGDRLICKTPIRNYLTKKPDPSIQRKTVYVKDHHDPIISRELWEKVQARMKMELEAKKEEPRPRCDSHPFFNRIICGSCGAPYRRNFYSRRADKGVIPVWKCQNRSKRKCWARIVPESEIAPIIEKADKVKITEFTIEPF